MPLHFLPGETGELKPRITVVGVGGAGGNAVNNMIVSKLEGVDFLVANTDAQSLTQSRTETRIQLGVGATQGLGAGSRPEVGRTAAEESMEDIARHLQGANMVFITAGMGGGTGTGAAPVIARAAREMGILTVGVVTKPFHFEGAHRMRTAEAGIEDLSASVDTLIVIPNQNLFRIATERTTFADAFKMADNVLYSGVRSVTDLMMLPGLINLDFADVRTVMSEMGKAMMGTGEAEGDNRALAAAEAAISNPLLDDTSMKGARAILINITGGADLALMDVDEAVNRIREEVDPDANLIFGSCLDETLEGKMRVSVVATGIRAEGHTQERTPKVTTSVTAAAMAPPSVSAPAAPSMAPAAPVAAAPVAPVSPSIAPVAAAPAAAPVMGQPTVTPVRPRPVSEAAFRASTPSVTVTANQGELPLDLRESAVAESTAAPTMASMEDSRFIRREPTLGEGRPVADMSRLSHALNEISNHAHMPRPAHREVVVETDEPVADVRESKIEVKEDHKRSQSMLSRLLNSQRAQTLRKEAEIVEPHFTTTRRDPITQEDGELDIPAFLRRQAN